MTIITRERVAEIIHATGLEPCDYEEVFGSIKTGEIVAMARIALASLEAEPVAWIVHSRGGDQLTTDANYVANAEGMGGIHSTPVYAAPPSPVVSDEHYRHLSELYHAQEKRLFKLAQRINGPSFDKYAHSPSQAIDVLESAIFGEREDNCRAALLQDSQPVSNRDELPSRERFISLCNEFWNWSEMDLVCADDKGYEMRMEWDGKVFTHPVTQSLWRMYHAAPGNSPVIPDCWCHTCRPVTMSNMRFVVCPECGNKRCPRANDHRKACTGSNEPGQ